jgi:hypothetical protein
VIPDAMVASLGELRDCPSRQVTQPLRELLRVSVRVFFGGKPLMIDEVLE